MPRSRTWEYKYRSLRFQTSTLDVDDWSAWWPSCFTPDNVLSVPTGQEAGGPDIWSAPAGNRIPILWSSSPYPSHYTSTDGAIPATSVCFNSVLKLSVDLRLSHGNVRESGGKATRILNLDIRRS
jgi:hypothetical protein